LTSMGEDIRTSCKHP